MVAVKVKACAGGDGKACSARGQKGGGLLRRREVGGLGVGVLLDQGANTRGAAAEVESAKKTDALKVVELRGSAPPVWQSGFEVALQQRRRSAAVSKAKHLNVSKRKQLVDIVSELQAGRAGVSGKKADAYSADVVTMGDVWLQLAITNGLIQPIPEAQTTTWWADLPPYWKKVAQRDAKGLSSDNGEIYGVPYRWGASLIAYREDKVGKALGRPIHDWDDLWNPSLKGRVAMNASTREVVGSSLKSAGLSYNASADTIRKALYRGDCEGLLQTRLEKIGEQVRLYSTKTVDAMNALKEGDLWVFVGWSSDLIPFARRSTNIKLAAPASGTCLWADLWTVPSGSSLSNVGLLHDWIEFTTDRRRCREVTGIIGGACPSLLVGNSRSKNERPSAAGNCGLNNIPIVTQKDGALVNDNMPSESTLRRSEFLLPLDSETEELYKSLL